MIPLSIRLKNFLSYRGETPVFDFTALHIAVLSGENGAGKSSFLEAIHWAVWGEARLRDAEVMHIGETSMYVEFEFAVNTNTYRILRSYSTSRRGGTKLELFQASDAHRTHWASLTQGSIRDTQNYITTTVVGMSYDVFANSAYLRQGRADAFTQLSPGERRDILAQILEINVYETYRERIKAKREVLRTEEVTLRIQMRNDEDSAATIPQLTQQLNEAEQRRDNATTFLAYAESALSLQQTRVTLATTTQQQHDITAVVAQLTSDIAHINTTLAQREEIETRYRMLCDLEAHARIQHTQRQQYDVLTQQRRATQAQIDHAAHALDVQIATLTQQIATLSEALTRRPDIATRHTQLATLLAQPASDDTQLAALQQQRRELQKTLTQHQHAQQRLNTLTLEQQRAQQRIAELERVTAPWATLNARLETCVAAQQQLRHHEQQRQQLSDTYATTIAQRDIVKQRGLELRTKKDTLAINQPCPTCQTMMDETHYTMAMADFDHEISQLREQYSTLNSNAQHTNTQIRTIDDDIARCTQLVDEMGDIRRELGAIDAARNELARLQTQHAQLNEEYTTLTAIDHAVASEQTMATLAQLDEQYQHAVAQLAQRDALTQQYAQLTTELDRLDTQASQLTHAEAQLASAIQQRDAATFAPEARADMLSIDDQLNALAYDPQATIETQQQIDALQDARTQYNELAVLTERHIALEQRQRDAMHTQQQLAQQIQTLDADIARFQTVCLELKPRLGERDLTGQPQLLKQNAETEIKHRSEHVNQLTVKLNLATEAQTRLAPQQERLAVVVSDIQRHETLERAFSGRGIQAMIIRDYAVPALEEETNEILSRMSDNQLHLHISTNTATQAGHLRETIEINVSDATGTRQLEAFSGGEAFRISFALRIALSKLMHQRVGYPLETLIIDEGFGTQDANGRERLVEAINAISNDFKTILVITHIQELRDLFPVQIAFRRVNGSSSWEILN